MQPSKEVFEIFIPNLINIYFHVLTYTRKLVGDFSIIKFLYLILIVIISRNY